MNNAAKGCGLLFVGMIAIALAIWALAILTWILGLVLVIGGAVGAIWASVLWWRRIGRAKEITSIDAEIQEMSRECYSELNDLHLRLLSVQSTKGIGTSLESKMRTSDFALESLMERCTSAMRLCEVAPATPQRIEAILNAQQTLHDIREEMRWRT